jgi:hypothetical protein
MAIEINKYANSSGSFIGVLNLTIESAPTNPRDKAKEDFTIDIIKIVVSVINGITVMNSDLFVRELEKRKKCNLTI